MRPSVIANAARLALGILALGLLTSAALAQSTATPVVPGYLTTSGCPSGYTTCFVQYGGGGGGGAPPYQETYLGHQTALTLVSSTPLTPTSTATIADIVVESNSTYSSAVRCLFDGTAPTTTTGLELQPGAAVRIITSTLSNVKCIQEAASAAIDVQYGK